MAFIKRYRSAQDVLVTIQNVLEVVSAAGKLGNGAAASCFNYRGQIQKLLDQGHSLDAVAGVHEEFIMHLWKHNSLDVAGDSVLGKSLFQSICADLPPPNTFQSQQLVRGSSWRGTGGGSLRGERPLPKDGCYVCKGEHFTRDCPKRERGPRGVGHGFSHGSHKSPFLEGPTSATGEPMLHTSNGPPLVVSTNLVHLAAADSSVSTPSIVPHSYVSVVPVHPAVHHIPSRLTFTVIRAAAGFT